MRRPIRRHGLAVRLVVAILLASSVVTLAGTALQLWVDYDKDVDAIEARLYQIEDSFLPALRASLWQSDDELVRSELEGIKALPDIEEVALDRPDGAPLRLGRVSSDRVMVRSFDLVADYKGARIPLGTLRVVAGTDRVIERTVSRILVILGTQAAKTSVMSAFILLIVYLLITRHVGEMAAFAEKVELERLDEPLRLRRRSPVPGKEDELDELARSLESMRTKLARSYARLRDHGERLSAEVAARTVDLEQTAARLRTEVAERTAAQETLRANESRLRVLLQRFPGAAWTVDEELRFQSGAGARAGDLALTEERRGCPLRELPEEGLGAVECLDAHRAAVAGESAAFELGVKGRTYDVHVEPFGEGGRGAIGVALDVTERRKLEAERLRVRLQEAQRLESLGMLAGGIAHDFNNLLVGILGHASLAEMRLPPGSPALASVHQIEVTAQRAADLTRQMLAYSGKGRFVVKPLDLSALVQEMAGLLEVSIAKRVVLRLDLGVGLPAVEADTAQVRQLVMNLITNAADAIGEGRGSISITTGVMQVDRAYLDAIDQPTGTAEGCYVWLEVSDTGRGMSEETRRRMFDPFFTTKATGHGLGLAACMGIVRGHRGVIKVYSEPGRGTSIKVLLPASERPAEPDHEEPVAPELGSCSGLVLVIDDDAAVRELATQALCEAGFDVVTATDGDEGVEVFRARGSEIVAVVLDMTMPRMSGEETFRELRRLRADVRVLLSSGYNEQDATNRFAGKGLAGFLQKPYRAGEIIARVQGIITKPTRG